MVYRGRPAIDCVGASARGGAVPTTALRRQHPHCACLRTCHEMTSTRYESANVQAPTTENATGATPRMRGRTPIDRDSLVLSVLIPVYNERNTIELILNQVHAVPVRKEIICVNDA